jgi:hypothetical protein
VKALACIMVCMAATCLAAAPTESPDARPWPKPSAVIFPLGSVPGPNPAGPAAAQPGTEPLCKIQWRRAGVFGRRWVAVEIRNVAKGAAGENLSGESEASQSRMDNRPLVFDPQSPGHGWVRAPCPTCPGG